MPAETAWSLSQVHRAPMGVVERSLGQDALALAEAAVAFLQGDDIGVQFA